MAKAVVVAFRNAGKIDAARALPYVNAAGFVLQKMMSGYTEMNKEYGKGGNAIKDMINNSSLMTNLGKLSAGDLILGNGDRVEGSNFGNIMLRNDGTIAAIDSAAILASFKQLCDASDNVPLFEQPFMEQSTAARRTEWVNRMRAAELRHHPTNRWVDTWRRSDP